MAPVNLALAWEREAWRSHPGALPISSAFSGDIHCFWVGAFALCRDYRLWTQAEETRRGGGEGGQSQALGDKDSACCFQRLSQLSKWNICIGFSREDEILRRTNFRKRHEWKGERRYEKTQYRLNPTSLFPPK